jgi:subtilisin family serine protease
VKVCGVVERLTRLALRRAMSRVAVPVIVEVHPARLLEVFEEARQYEFRLVPGVLERVRGELELPLYEARLIKAFSMFSMVLPREVVFDLAEDSRVVRIYSDEVKYALQYPAVPPEGVYSITHLLRGKRVEFTSTYWTKRLIGADVANRKGFTGRGVKVAVLDTGVSTLHEQLRRRVYKFLTVYPGLYFDLNGHGTWCTACVSGSLERDDVLSRMSGRDILCEGVAPECTLYHVKVLGFVIGAGTDSAIIKGLELALSEGVKVVSMSLGGAVEVDSQEEDPFYPVVKKMLESGVVPVVAAGNEGPEPGTIATPGWLEDVLTVGAYDPITGEVAKYSSRGPTRDGRIKPDVVAPGGGHPDHGIDSAVVNLLDRAGDGIPNRYSPLQGTSMATPHVAGLVALMAQAHRELLGRDLGVEEVKRMMESLGHPKNSDAGWGAITWQLYEQWLETQYGVKMRA